MGLFEDLEALVRNSGNGRSTAAEVLANAGTPSVSIAVLDHGEISSYCFSTVGDDSDTIFQAASISKVITALAMMRLVEQQLLTLDQTIKDLLPGDVLDLLTQDESQSRKGLIEGITIRQLMSHTSGLSVSSYFGYPVKDGQPPACSLKEIISGKHPANTMRLRLTGLPGHGLVYSGGGITVQQIIMQAITGQDFPTLMQDLVLGHTPCENAQHFFPESAAAGLWTTPTDLLKAVLAVQNSLDGSGFLQQATAKEMLTEVDSGVGLTWVLPGDEGTLFQHIGGNDPGYICFVTGFVDLKGGDSGASVPQRSGMAVMTNSFQGLVAAHQMYTAVPYLKKWPAMLKARTAYVPLPMPEQDPGIACKRWEGSCWMDEKKKQYYTITTGDDGKPRLTFNEFAPVRLFPTAGPESKFADGSGFCELALEGMDMLVRLKGEKGQEKLQICDGRSDTVTDLTWTPGSESV